MNIPPGKQPATVHDYEQGRAAGEGGSGAGGSPGSFGSRLLWSDSFNDNNNNRHESHSRGSSVSPLGGDRQRLDVRRRRSSRNVRLNALAQMGGVNSMARFAASWQRAAGFQEVAPIRPSFRLADPDDEGPTDEEYGDPTSPKYGRKDVEQSPEQHARSLLREAFENYGRRMSDNAVDTSHGDEQNQGEAAEDATEYTPLRVGSSSRLAPPNVPSSWADSLFSLEPSLTSGFGGSYGTMYASRASRAQPRPVPNISEVFREDAVKLVPEDAEESIDPNLQEPLLIKQIEEEGVTYNVVVGQSTLPQTVFNSVNVLIGVGLLSLPLGMLYSGWVVGTLFMCFAGLATRYTAKLLAKCLDVDNSLITFADLAYVSFGRWARLAISMLFCIELIAACVALVILFSDSLSALLPGLYDGITWKIICGVVLIPLSFLPLNLLSFTSVLGILCCLGIFLAVLIDGLIKPDTPGSLRSPATTYLFPEHWQTIPLAFGLLMSPWGGHSVFPNIYRDMRHPYKYHRAVDITYLFTFCLDAAMAIIGILMFGDGVMDEITSNILLTKGYPRGLAELIAVCIAIIPLTKVPLNARPIVSTVEVITGLIDPNARGPERHPVAKSIGRAAVKVGTVIVFVLISIAFPSFDRIMTLLGAVCCFSICIVLPVAFHLKLFWRELSPGEKMLDWSLLIVSSLMAIVSTAFACAPREWLDGEI